MSNNPKTKKHNTSTKVYAYKYFNNPVEEYKDFKPSLFLMEVCNTINAFNVPHYGSMEVWPTVNYALSMVEKYKSQQELTHFYRWWMDQFLDVLYYNVWNFIYNNARKHKKDGEAEKEAFNVANKIVEHVK